MNVVQELSGTATTANLLSGGIDEVFQRTDSSGGLFLPGGCAWQHADVDERKRRVQCAVYLWSISEHLRHGRYEHEFVPVHGKRKQWHRTVSLWPFAANIVCQSPCPGYCGSISSIKADNRLLMSRGSAPSYSSARFRFVRLVSIMQCHRERR